MLIQTVQFESVLPEKEALRIANERAEAYRAVPGLVQKYYVKLNDNQWRGVLLWESKEALAAFRDTELSRTIPTAYGVKGAPSVELVEVFLTLRSDA